jgi:hypothetical protein
MLRLARAGFFRVARTPNDYASDAVVVAKNILKERRVSLEEMDAAEWELAQSEMAAAIGKPRIGDYIERFTEVFRPDRGQASETGPGWYTALLVFYGVYYIINIYSVTKYLVYLHRCETCMPDMAGIGWNLALAVFITVCFYFVLKQKSLGWAMLHTMFFSPVCCHFMCCLFYCMRLWASFCGGRLLSRSLVLAARCITAIIGLKL